MLTKSEYSTSTSSLSTVFSGSLLELNSSIGKACLPESATGASHQPSSLRNRLRDRINKNKSRIGQLQRAIEVSKKDILTISDMRKAIFENEVAPLMTFVDQVKNTTDQALLSMQRELASKETDLSYVVYDRNVVCLDHKLSSAESACLKHYKHTTGLFKENVLAKENAKINAQAEHSEMLLKQGEGLMQICKQQIEEKDKKVKQLASLIHQKERLLDDRYSEINQLQNILTQQARGGNSKMKSYILTAKLKNMKQDIRRLLNEKNDLEATEQEYSRGIGSLKVKISKMEKRKHKEETKVKGLEQELGLITRKNIDGFETRSMVESSEVTLKDYLKSEKAKKEKLLKEVNSTRKELMSNKNIKSLLDTKTLKPVDWNQIDEDQVSQRTPSKKVTWKESDFTKINSEETKLPESAEDSEKHENLSLLSFDPD